MFPSPSTAEPSDTTATVFLLIVRVNAFFRFFVDRHANAGDVRRINAGQVVAVMNRRFRLHFDFAAEVKQECPVRDVDEPQAFQSLELFGNEVDLHRILNRYGQVANAGAASRLNDVDGYNVAAGFGNGCSHVTECQSFRVEFQAKNKAFAAERFGFHGHSRPPNYPQKVPPNDEGYSRINKQKAPALHFAGRFALLLPYCSIYSNGITDDAAHHCLTKAVLRREIADSDYP